MNKSGMGSHQSARMIQEEWLTPQWILDALGPFDLDPCAPKDRPWDMARNHYTKEDNGLMLPWGGRIWCNPPYGKHTDKWLSRCWKNGNAIALIFARTETQTFFKWVWEKADGILFIKRRIYFYNSDGTQAQWTGGAPSVLVAYGTNNAEILKHSEIEGSFIQKWVTIPKEEWI